MQEAEFAVGDVVRIKSGGPKMTISDVYDAESKYVDAVFWSEEHEGLTTIQVDRSLLMRAFEWDEQLGR